MPTAPMPNVKVTIFLTTTEQGKDSIVETRYLDSDENIEEQVEAQIAYEMETRQPGFQIGGVSWVVGQPLVMDVEQLEKAKEKGAARRSQRELQPTPPREQTDEELRLAQRRIEEQLRQREALKTTIFRKASGLD